MIDTHSVIKRLIASGMPEGQAEVVTMIVRESRDDMAESAATKADIVGVRADISRVETTLKADIARVETTLKADISRVEATLKADIARVAAAVKGDILEETAPIKAQMFVMKWMLGFVLAFQIAIFVRLFIH